MNRSTTGTQVVKSTGEPDLTLSPGRIDPTNPVWTAQPQAAGGRVHLPRPAGVRDRQPLRRQARRPERRRALPVPGAVLGHAARRPGLRSSTTSSRASSTSTARPTSSSSATSTTTSSARRSTCSRPGTADGTGDSILTDLIATLPIDQQYTYDFDGISRGAGPHPGQQGTERASSTRWCTSTPSTPTRSPTTTRRWCASSRRGRRAPPQGSRGLAPRPGAGPHACWDQDRGGRVSGRPATPRSPRGVVSTG